MDSQISHYKLNKLDKQMQKIEKLIKSDISENNHFEILDIQEKERQRIARELHDSSVQNLTHLIHTIELSSMFIDQDPIRAKLELESCIKLLKLTIDEMREVIFNLRPMSFDDLGFKQCIDDFITNCRLQFKNCEIEYNVCELSNEKWESDDKQKINLFLLTVYRIIQEPIINALKHSGADKIFFNLTSKNEKCCISIIDNGKGFSLEDVMTQKDKHFGLSILEERVNFLYGEIVVNTAPGKGTKIKIEIPLI